MASFQSCLVQTRAPDQGPMGRRTTCHPQTGAEEDLEGLGVCVWVCRIKESHAVVRVEVVVCANPRGFMCLRELNARVKI